MNLCRYTTASRPCAYVDGKPVYQERDHHAMVNVMPGALAGLTSPDGVTLGTAQFKGQRQLAVVIHELATFFKEGTR